MSRNPSRVRHSICLHLLFMVLLLSVAFPATGSAQVLDGGTGLLLNSSADVLHAGRFGTGVGWRGFSKSSQNMWESPLYLVGGLGMHLETSLQLPLRNTNPDSPRLLGDYSTLQLKWRMLGEDEGPFRLAVKGSVQEELLYNRPGYEGGALFVGGAVASMRTFASWQLHLNALYAESKSDITSNHWVLGAGMLGHLSPTLEGMAEIRHESAGYVDDGAILQAIAGCRWTPQQNLMLSLGVGLARVGSDWSPVVHSGVLFFTEPIIHRDYGRFVSRIRPLPLDEVDQLLNESVLNPEATPPPPAIRKGLLPLIGFRKDEVIFNADSLLAAAILDSLRHVPPEAYLRIVASGDASNDAISSALLGVSRAASMALWIADHDSFRTLSHLLVSSAGVESPDSFPFSSLRIERWDNFLRDVHAAKRRGRATNVENPSPATIDLALHQAGTPDANELAVFRAKAGDPEKVRQAFGEVLRSAVRLIASGVVQSARLTFGVVVDSTNSIPLFETHPQVNWVMDSWTVRGDSLEARLRIEGEQTPRIGSTTVVGLLQTPNGWMSTYGDLLAGKRQVDMRRSRILLLSGTSSLNLRWRIPCDWRGVPVMRVKWTGEGQTFTAIPENRTINEQWNRVIKKDLGLPSEPDSLQFDLRVIAGPYGK